MNLEQLGPILGPILFVIITLASCLLLGFKILEKVAEKKNGKKLDLEMIPGHSEECQERGDTIVKLVMNHEFVTGQIKEINTNVGNLWKHVKKNGLG